MAVETHPRISARSGDAAQPSKGGDAELGDLFAAVLNGATLPEEEGAAEDGDAAPASDGIAAPVPVTVADEQPVDPIVTIALTTITAPQPDAVAETEGEATAQPDAEAAVPPEGRARPLPTPEVSLPTPAVVAETGAAPATTPASAPATTAAPAMPAPYAPPAPAGKSETPSDAAADAAPDPVAARPAGAGEAPRSGVQLPLPPVMRPVDMAEGDAPAPTAQTSVPTAAPANPLAKTIDAKGDNAAPVPPAVAKPAPPPAVDTQPGGDRPSGDQPRGQQTALQMILAQGGFVVPQEGRAGHPAATAPVAAAKIAEASAPSAPAAGATVAPQPIPESLQAMIAPMPSAPAMDARAAGPLQQGQPVDQAIEQQLDLAHESEWLDRLSRDIAGAGGKDGTMRFRLAPEHLGNLQVELRQQAAGTAVRLTAETEAARAILADAHPRLMAEARAQGVRIAEAHVDVGSGRPGQQENAADQQRQDQPGASQAASALRGKKSVTTSALTMSPRAADRFA